MMEPIPVQKSGNQHADGKGSDRQKACLDAMPFPIGQQAGKKIGASRIPRADQQGRGARQDRPCKIYVGMIREKIEGDKGQQKHNNNTCCNNFG